MRKFIFDLKLWPGYGKQRTNKENQDENIRDDDTTDFHVRIGMLNNAKTRWEKDICSRNKLTSEDRRGYKTTQN